MNNYLKVEGNPNLLRDARTNAIINTDKNLVNAYIANKNRKIQQNNTIENIENEINSMKNDISEIKHLLNQLLK